MMDTDEKFEMTQDEMKRIKEAMKDKEFVRLLLEYSQEISDPENKKKYEEDIVAMEKERGSNVRVLSPQSGFVVKTERLTDRVKVFVNICSSPEIKECSYNAEIQNGKHGTHVSIPHSLSPMKEDIDRAGKSCVVYDVCFHPKTYAKSLEEIRFRELLIDTALDTLEKQSNAKVDRKKKRFPKMKYKGTPRTNIIRPVTTEGESDSVPMDNKMIEELNDLKKSGIETNGTHKTEIADSLLETKPLAVSGNQNRGVVTPEYKIVHRGYFDMQNFTYARESYSNIPKELVVRIKLPLAKSAAGMDLVIFEKELTLDSKEPPYHLEISLPYKVNEAEGQAQFDTAEKALVVTLPLVKPEKNGEICEIPTQPSVVDVTGTLDNNEVKTEVKDDLHLQNPSNEPVESVSSVSPRSLPTDENDSKDDDTTLQYQLTDNSAMENEPVESVCSMMAGSLPTVDGDANEEDDDDDDTVLVDIETIREYLQKDMSDSSRGVDVEFDTSNFECFRASSKLPPYSYTQTPEQINLTIDVPDVRVVCLSLGFSEQQAYMSYPRNPDDANSPFWELVVRLGDGCYLDKDNCGVDVTEQHMELILRKRSDSKRLWEKFFVGLSETSLKVEFFTTDDIAEDMLRSIGRTKSGIIDMQSNGVGEDATLLNTDAGDSQREKKLTGLESRLSQLLKSQEESECADANAEHKQTINDAQKNSMNFKETNGVAEGDDENENPDEKHSVASDVSIKFDQMHVNGNVDIKNSEKNVNTRADGRADSGIEVESPSMLEESPSTRRQFGRSLSLGNDSSYEGDGCLHSILKHSRSDGEYYCDTEEDDLSCSANSFTDSIYGESVGESVGSEPTFGRRRIKSVTFNDEPTIFEFAKLSKRQLKKQMKEERLRQAAQSKGLLSKFSQSAPPATVNEMEEKGKSKKKDKCERKARSYSDGLLQVPNSILTRHKMQKKKKKNKKNKKQDSEESPSNSLNDISSLGSNVEQTAVLNNPLIFELE